MNRAILLHGRMTKSAGGDAILLANLSMTALFNSKALKVV